MRTTPSGSDTTSPLTGKNNNGFESVQKANILLLLIQSTFLTPPSLSWVSIISVSEIGDGAIAFASTVN